MQAPQSWRTARCVALLLSGVACSHSEPFASRAPDPLGPADPALPRQLTFTLGDDRSPNVTGGTVAFSRFDRGEAPGNCMVFMPAEGGTLTALVCPPAPSAADTFVSSWLEPALAPDGRRVAYVWRRSARVSALSAWSYDLVVASVDSPGVPLASHSLLGMLPGNRIMNTAMEIVWIAPERLRYLAGFDSIFRVNGAGTSRYTDTATIGLALMDFDVTTGKASMVPGGDTVAAWTSGPEGTFIVPGRDAASVFALADDGTRTLVGRFSLPVADLAVVGGVLVAAVAEDSILWMEPGTGRSGRALLRGSTRRLAPSGSDRVVAEVERRGGDQFGAPANLWLVGLPAAQTVR